ncbi:MAG: FAD-dependent oxidoreductase [Planctomycetes bacterium]|nr:FAD-dependent oxidoreductase [Planctomycetota bacterium]
MRAGLMAGGTCAYFGGAHILLRDPAWSPNDSYWIGSASGRRYPALDGETEVEVAIIGAGFTGLSAALHIKRRFPDSRIAVLEARSVGFGASGRNGGVICTPDGEGRHFGAPSDLIPRTVRFIRDEGIDCDLDESRNHLNPCKLALGLAELWARSGVEIFEDSRVTALDRDGPGELRGDRFRVRAQRLILATNAYTASLGAFRRGLVPIHTGTIVTDPLPASVLRDVPAVFGVSIRGGPNAYWGRTLPGDRLLFGGGMRYCYDNGLAFGGMARLAPVLVRAMEAMFPRLEGARAAYAWSGPLGAFPDLIPRIGALEGRPHILYALGYAGVGLTMALRAGEYLRDLLSGGTLPSWCSRPVRWLPGEPLRFMAVNAGLHLMDLGVME